MIVECVGTTLDLGSLTAQGKSSAVGGNGLLRMWLLVAVKGGV